MSPPPPLLCVWMVCTRQDTQNTQNTCVCSVCCKVGILHKAYYVHRLIWVWCFLSQLFCCRYCVRAVYVHNIFLKYVILLVHNHTLYIYIYTKNGYLSCIFYFLHTPECYVMYGIYTSPTSNYLRIKSTHNWRFSAQTSWQQYQFLWLFVI